MAKTETPVHCWVCNEPLLADDDGNIESGGIWDDDCHGYMMCHKECEPRDTAATLRRFAARRRNVTVPTKP